MTPGSVFSLVLPGGLDPRFKLIRNDQYDLLFEEIGELAARGDDSRRVAPKLARGRRPAERPLIAAAGPIVDADRLAVARGAAPAPGELAGVRVRRDATVLGELRRTPNAPGLSFTFPEPGDRWSGTRRVEWRGRDADGDRLFYTLRYSPTGDTPWTVLALDVEATSLELDASRLDPGPDPTLELRATDGFDQTTTRVSFTLDRKLPVRPGWPVPGDTVDPRWSRSRESGRTFPPTRSRTGPSSSSTRPGAPCPVTSATTGRAGPSSSGPTLP